MKVRTTIALCALAVASLFAFPLLFPSCSFALAADPAPRYVVEVSPDEDTSRITVAARQGSVAWRDVLQGLAASERLDEDALGAFLPSGQFSLKQFGAQATLLGLNLAFDGAARFDILRDESDSAIGLVITVRRDVMRTKLRRFKSRVRQHVMRWRGAEEPYSLELDSHWKRASETPLAILVHGYTSQPTSLAPLRRQLRKHGVVTGAFGYPNDGAVLPSGKQLVAALGELKRQAPTRRIQLIAHSMGGLVCRVAIELDEDASQTSVVRLITIATPHLGSSLARVPVSVDAWEAIADGRKFQMADFIVDGLNEARDDLRPDSRFQRRLKLLSRNPKVDYSVIIGNVGFVHEGELDRVRQHWLELQQGHPLIKAMGPRLNECLEDIDEIVHGKGDGVVSVARGRLPDVKDTIILPFKHWALTNDLANQPELSKAVVQRATAKE